MSPADRQALRHPGFRGETVELLAVASKALLELYPPVARARVAALRLDVPGSAQVAEALAVAVRALGLRAPEVMVSDEPGAPVSLEVGASPRLLVARQVLKQPIGDGVLRFFAARSMFMAAPELLVLRALKREQLLEGISILARIAEGKLGGADERTVRSALTAEQWATVKELAPRMTGQLDVTQLWASSRHTVNRAGLVVSGGVAPAVVALKQKQAQAVEMGELIRFAASERYFELRERH